MPNPTNVIGTLSPLKRALLALDDMKARLDGAERSKNEPVAIVGMGCRFPGGDQPESFWRLLRDGASAVREVPKDRWDLDEYYDPDPNVPGKTYTRWGAFLDRIDGFDPQFFSIAPREAVGIDPQQRLLLEVAWEALEHAAVAPDRLSGSSTGVFIGICSSDYATLQLRSADVSRIDAYSASGTAHSIAAGRLSYVLGLQGPAVAIDTACSSSLVAVHLACQSLRNDECRMALAGGVHLLVSPLNTVTFCKLHMLAPDGRCKTFDASGDGFVEGEGCGVVVLKRLSDALADGDNIVAVIRGSAVNQDGASSGLTAPNGPAQESVIRAALRRAGVRPAEIGYVEAHGTGTSLGDPIEVQALAAVLGEDRPAARPVIIGSVKTNIGHTEGAAGIAGLMKLVLALQHEEIPRHLNFSEPNPFIPWAELPVKVATESVAWPRGDARRVGGVSSFGFSGTNAHIVIEEAPVRETAPAAVDRPLHVLALSARTEAALNELAGRWDRYLADHSDAALADVAHTANAGRAHLPHRIAIVADSMEQLRSHVAAAAADAPAPRLVRSKVSGGDRPKIAFLFTGQGAQYSGMGRELYETQPTFRRALDRCAELLEGHIDRPLPSLIYSQAEERAIDRTAYAQPALFAVEYALAELWRSWGVVPSAVLGHSIGEYVAACVAGVLGLEDAVKLVAARGRLMQSLPSGGAMAAVLASEPRVRAAVERDAERLSIAAVNAPENVVVSGPVDAIDAVVARFASEGVVCERLSVSHAFHSSLMDPILSDFERLASGVTYESPRITLVSNLTGQPARRDIGTAAYWRDHLRQPVRFAGGVAALYDLGYRVFLEVGPKPTLSSLARRSLSGEAVCLPSLRKSGTDWQQMLDTLVALYARGVEVDWDGVDRDYPRRKLAVPTYPFQRERYWFAAPAAPRETSRRLTGKRSSHPLLGARLSSALKDAQFESSVSGGFPSFLGDHRKRGATIFPAAAYLEMGLAAAREALGGVDHVLDDLAITEPLLLHDDEPATLQTIVSPDAKGGGTVRIFTRGVGAGAGSEHWRLHATGVLRLAQPGDAAGAEPLDAVRARCTEAVPVDRYYDRLLHDGHEYGPAFRGMVALWRGENEALARIELPAGPSAEAAAYGMHPALLDASMQLLGAALPGSAEVDSAGETYLPVSLGSYRLRTHGHSRGWSHVRLRPSSDADGFSADVCLYDEAGAVMARLVDVYLRRSTVAALRPAPQLYELAWRRKPRGTNGDGHPAQRAGSRAGTWVILCDDDRIGAQLAQRLDRQGVATVLVQQASTYAASGDRVRMDSGDRTHAARMLEDARAVHGEPLAGLVHLWSLAAGADALTDGGARGACGSLLHLVQALAETGLTEPPALRIVTRGAVAIDGVERDVVPAQAPIWGLARTIVSEYPDFTCTCIDLDPGTATQDGAVAPVDLDLLEQEVLQPDAENQIAFRDGQRYAARLSRLQPSRTVAAPVDPGPVALETGAQGLLDRLELRPAARRTPGAGEIEVRVAAAGLNFRDVLNALGMYEGEAGPLGSECVGTVIAAGADVTHVRLGDTVLGMVAGGLRTYVTARAGAFVAKPDCLTTEEAATVPVTFLTAEYALNRLAGMRRGDRVLIHAAAGGVGLAAVQLAQRAGAEIIATAGSAEKHAFLHALGVRHVFSSRTLDFADRIREVTAGEGVDLVLNSLSGDFIEKSLSVLRPGGHFLEIGKSGIWDVDRMAAARPDISYHRIYLGDVDHSLVQEMLRGLMAAMEAGRLTPLRFKTFPLTRAVDAFRYMAQARHIGKIVLTLDAAAAPRRIRADATYLITGGLGALGLKVASGLARLGATHLVLVGRSAPSEEALELIRLIEQHGAVVRVARVDVSREREVARLLEDVGCTMPPLAGVIHAAGVLDDGVLGEQTWARFEKVLAPKVAGAWHLHRLTEAVPLDFFVMFSSMVALFGGPGQGNYAAANAFLDALAHHRRGQGLPALSINWGAWADAGMAAAVAERNHGRWREQGFGFIQPDEGIAILERLLQSAPGAQVAALPIDWPTLLRRFPTGAEPPLFSELAVSLADSSRAAATPPRPVSLRAELASVAPGRRRSLVQKRVREEAVKVLGLGSDAQPDTRQPLRELGLDSLMAVELRNALADALGQALPATLLFKYPTLEALAEFLISQLGGDASPDRAREENGPGSEADQDLLDLEACSDDEARELLSRELESLAGSWTEPDFT